LISTVKLYYYYYYGLLTIRIN